MSALAYVKEHYPALLSDVWLFQEELRVREARGWDPARSPRGWTAVDAIRRAAAADGLIALPPAFAGFVHGVLAALPEETKDTNVCRAVRAVWTWEAPQLVGGLLPWILVRGAVRSTVIAAANTILCGRDVTPRLTLVEGKVHLKLSGFTAALWAQLPGLGDVVPGVERPLVRNTESDHVTVVNSDVVAATGALPAAIAEWLAVQPPVRAAAVGLQHTISLDWAPFSVYLAVVLESFDLVAFVAAFNARFNVAARPPSSHIIVAIDPRTS